MFATGVFFFLFFFFQNLASDIFFWLNFEFLEKEGLDDFSHHYFVISLVGTCASGKEKIKLESQKLYAASQVPFSKSFRSETLQQLSKGLDRPITTPVTVAFFRLWQVQKRHQ